jgi:hypothetical protein
VQTLLSLQEAVLFVWTQPLDVLHESSVQTLLSSQFGAFPPVHVPVLHASAVVQAFPSSQVVLFSDWQVPVASHAWQSLGLFPPHAVLQQKLSTQVFPPAHCASREQDPPGGRTVTHWFDALQKKPDGQSVSTPHAP